MRLILCILSTTLTVTFGALLMSDVYELARWCNKQPEVNGTEDDVNDLLMGYLPETRHGMCMLWCMEMQTGILVNNTFSIKGTYEFFRNAFPECPYFRNIERGVMFCAKHIAKKAGQKIHYCQYAHMVATCVKYRIKYVPGCKAAFYRPFIWKNYRRQATIKPAAQKYFEVRRRRPTPALEFEIITKPPKNYTFVDAEGLLSSESNDDGPYMYLPPRMRKGKKKFDKQTDRRDKKRKGKKGEEESDEGSSISMSIKRRRHQKRPLI